MPCLICRDSKTIKAHLIPKAFAREVQVGKAHAVVRDSGEYADTQSGIWDRDILCRDCDNTIGKWEGGAKQSLDALRADAAGKPEGIHRLAGTRGDDIIRFLAALLWKYASTKPALGRIQLGPYRAILEDISFRGTPIHSSVNAVGFRLRREQGDDGVFAYRAPQFDRKSGINMVRLMVGGVVFFVKLDQRVPSDAIFREGGMAGQTDLPYWLAPAPMFEEFTRGRDLANRGELSLFLDRQAGLEPSK
ncbi:hypothetical protein [Myxococcus sp. AS-1-15]|uniref:hypothetical protein n=1 Tax=Myxococcus sp. AS-1-15 TaxID=2874600 RepID=UPI001CBAC660|nr:hypothetical protein [Myxococcus sp. AS-1-15]MBZ4401238.1 hypothetical protein [Myxococcus sp. AS-1-15]BDT32981.1 hypothetical protein MFMH1_26500 [Myxococcus sp. MH1]